MTTTVIKNENSKDEIIKQVNKIRLENKNKWYCLDIHYPPFNYKIKAYNTWMQLITVIKDGDILYRDSGNMDISITEFKNELKELIK